VRAHRDIPIALLGYGTVGSAVDRHLREHGDALAGATGLRLRVVHALVRDPRKERAYAPLPGVLTTDFAKIREDREVVAVAELMGGLDPTRRYIEELLADGKGVATANKQLLARNGHDLLGRVRAGGSVCGAIQVLGTLREGLPPGGITRVTGIVNGTTNFVLARIEAGADYAEALADAQQRGYAEADPTEDVTGADAAAKMAIIATTAFGDHVTLADVAYEGIDRVNADEVRAARARGRALRLVGIATRDGVEVRLTELDAAHPLAQLEGADNAVVIEGAGFRRIVLSGPGAGGAETASAVVADLLELAR
jgi:homoserine dehydrogenase